MINTTKLILPFTNEWFVLSGGDTKSINHHHGNKAQNFAFDFTKTKHTKSFKNQGKFNDDYYCFAKPIICPADGVVVEAVDGVKDNQPGNGNYLAGAGNYIVVQHSKDEYSFLAHLKQGSVAVVAGESVVTGQHIADCGNSGTSFAPHLHYHLQDSEVLVTYKCEYDRNDRSCGNSPTNIDVIEHAAGIKAQFSDITVNGVKKQLYSPVRGELISNCRYIIS